MSRPARNSQVLLLLALPILMAGCDSQNLLNAPLQARFVDGQLGVRVCTSITSDRISVKARAGGEWEEVWMADGDAVLDSRDVLTTDRLSEVYSRVARARDPEVIEGDELVVVLYGENGSNLAASFLIDDAMEAGDWGDPQDVGDRDCEA